ncbi:MarR family transcriptional regulator [Bradyrhizobium sp. ARR65]|uniref:MarR family winged helix-turn-helix transcriptional regulator n=1 Tax=Bradyrhizobium sp. ARR65 TaxID=1040989 RepID=UPI00046378CB|nr:MarR family transcriptional regulator [Bradyrhizobium sp. ARR65]
MPHAVPEPDDFICFAIYSAGHAFNRLYKPLLESIGLTYPQYLVMIALWARNDQTVGDLGETLLLESSTLTPLLKRLEKSGLLSRSRDPEDERQVRVRLTRKGAGMRTKARDFPSCVKAATGFSNEALRRLRNDILSMRSAVLQAAD